MRNENYNIHLYICSECGNPHLRKTNYCDQCGAKMEVEKYLPDTNIGNMSEVPTGSEKVRDNMADIELVIKIPEEIYERFGYEYREENLISKHTNDIILDAFCNAIPLPKGHGRIMDEKDILDIKNNDGGWYDLVDMPEYIAGVKAIIEADKEEE